MPEIMSSAIIALLTLTLVWIELSKRPELKLLRVLPIRHYLSPLQTWKADVVHEVSKPSGIFRIKQVKLSEPKFQEDFSFIVDLANIGYEEIMAYEYAITLDGERQTPHALSKPSNYDESLCLRTQQRYPIEVNALKIKNGGFHKISLVAYATSIYASVWIFFCVSKDLKTIRFTFYSSPVSLLFTRLIRWQLSRKLD